jgi:phosphoribosylformimino-5-aminoimidazole carboxamide ribotide isomerase
MIIYPAIDLRQGRVVRLVHGDPTLETVHSDDPVATAEAGARFLSVSAEFLAKDYSDWLAR